MPKLNWDVLDDVGHGVRSVQQVEVRRIDRTAGVGRQSTMSKMKSTQFGTGTGLKTKSKLAISAVSVLFSIPFIK